MDAEVLFAAMVAGPVFSAHIAHYESTRPLSAATTTGSARNIAPWHPTGYRMGVIPITMRRRDAEMKHCKKLGLKGCCSAALA